MDEKEKSKAYQPELPLGVLNESVEYYLIEQNKEEGEIKKLTRGNPTMTTKFEELKDETD